MNKSRQVAAPSARQGIGRVGVASVRWPSPLTLLGCLAAVTLLWSDAAGIAQLPPATVHFPTDRDVVEVPFETYRQWIVVPVRVHGSEPLRFILDTGAPYAVLANAAVGDGLPLEIVGRARLAGAGEGEPLTAPLAGNVELELGALRISGGAMAVGVPLKAIAGTDGIIGGPLFDQLVVEIDWAAERLRFHDPARFIYLGSGIELPLRRMASGHHYTVAGIDAAGVEAVPVNLVVDTGALHALSLDPAALPGVQPEGGISGTIVGFGANGPAHGDIARISGLRLDDILLRDVVTTFPRNGAWSRMGQRVSMTLHGNLGLRVLRRFRVIFDAIGSRMILEPGADVDRPFSFNTTGLRPRPWAAGDEEIELAAIIEGSPAAIAGLLTGDRITALDHRPVAEIPVNEVESLLEGEPGTELTMTVRRGDATLEVTVVRERLV